MGNLHNQSNGTSSFYDALVAIPYCTLLATFRSVKKPESGLIMDEPGEKYIDPRLENQVKLLKCFAVSHIILFYQILGIYIFLEMLANKMWLQWEGNFIHVFNLFA